MLFRRLFSGHTRNETDLQLAVSSVPESETVSRAKKTILAACQDYWSKIRPYREADLEKERQRNFNYYLYLLTKPGWGIPFVLGHWPQAKESMLEERLGQLKVIDLRSQREEYTTRAEYLTGDLAMFRSGLCDLSEDLQFGLTMLAKKMCSVAHPEPFIEYAIPSMFMGGRQDLQETYLDQNLWCIDQNAERFGMSERAVDLHKRYVLAIHWLLGGGRCGSLADAKDLVRRFEHSPSSFYADTSILFDYEKESYVALCEFMLRIVEKDTRGIVDSAWNALAVFSQHEGAEAFQTLFVKCLQVLAEKMADPASVSDEFVSCFPLLNSYLDYLKTSHQG